MRFLSGPRIEAGAKSGPSPDAGFAGKPRPAVIVQDDIFSTASVTVCGFTTNEVDAPHFRVPVLTTPENGLDHDSRIMIDKTMTVPRHQVGERLGRLTPADMMRVDRALALFLGLAS